MQGGVNLSQNFAFCGLVSFDPKFCRLFNGINLVVAKKVFKLNFWSNIYNNSLSRRGVESVYVFTSNRPLLAALRRYHSIVVSFCFDWFII